MTKLVVGIMCGGRGERLWPLSGEAKPKQLLQLIGEKSSLQKLVGLMNEEMINVVMISNVLHRPEVLRQMNSDGLSYHEILWEQRGYNTCYATALMAWRVKEKYGEDTVLITMPSDQYWGDESNLVRSLRKAAAYAAENDRIVSLGISPKTPSSQYGYIMLAENGISNRFAKVSKFTEKPAVSDAAEWIKTGKCLWNSGIYCAKVGSLLAEIEDKSPDIYQQSLRAVTAAEFSETGAEVRIPTISAVQDEENTHVTYPSIDRAVMEKTSNLVALNLGEIFWEDIGSFAGLVKASHHYGARNLRNVNMLDVQNSYAYSGDKPVYIMGMDGVIVLNLADKIIVMDQKYANEDIKKTIQLMANSKESESG